MSREMWRFERPHRFALGLSLFDAAVEVGVRLGLVLGADERDGVDGVVDLAITAAVEAVWTVLPERLVGARFRCSERRPLRA